MSELIEKLKDGVPLIGMHEDNNTEMFDVEEASDTMSEAADVINDLKEAIRPFYACVFNDNGDIEINQSHLTRQDWLKLNNIFKDK